MTRSLLASAALVLVLAGGAAPRDSGAATIPARVLVNQLAVGLTISPSRTSVGKPVKARVTLTNIGQQALLDLRATLRLDTVGLVVTGDAIQTVTRLDAGRIAKLDWVLCPRQAGNYIVVAQATSRRADGVAFVSESPAAALIATPGRGSCT